MTPPAGGSLPGGWVAALLAGAEPLAVPAARRDPARWPGYAPREAVGVGWRRTGGPVTAVWDGAVLGGSLGEDDATALVAAVDLALAERRPLVTVVRSGGTRLQEGMAALVGIPRVRLALHRLAAAGLPHVSVADAPTTGGVWVGVASTADLRVAVEGATVGFAGPRVVQAVTGALPPAGSHTAASAAAAGLVDAVLPADAVAGWVQAALAALAPIAPSRPLDVPAERADARAQAGRATGGGEAGGGGWAQVTRSRQRTAGGEELLRDLLTSPVGLAAPRGDRTVAALVGRLEDRPVVGIALAAAVGTRPTPDGFRLATRAVRLAGRLGLPLLALVDTPGAEPGTEAEQDGLAPAIGEAMDALLTCPSPTLALVHGEGGSGGALALSVCDVLLLTPDAWFGAIAPEGAAAALRRPVEECAELLRLTPADLLALGAADAVVHGPGALGPWLADLAARDPEERLAARSARWSAPLPGRL